MNGGSLAGMSAVVTGASAGIGYSSAEILLRDGAAVTIMGRRDETLREARARLLAAAPGGRVDMSVGDARKEADVRAALEHAHAMQDRLDMVVATVGGGAFKPFLMCDLEDLTDDLDHNVASAFLAIRHGAPLMREGGSVVCISSVSAMTPLAYSSTYNAAKAGLEQLARNAALELAAAQVRVNIVRPGLTRTAATEGMFDHRATLQAFVERIPLGRGGEPDEVAEAVRFLAGPESKFVTGQTISVDGGLELRGHPDLGPLVEAIYGAQAVRSARAGRVPHQ